MSSFADRQARAREIIAEATNIIDTTEALVMSRIALVGETLEDSAPEMRASLRDFLGFRRDVENFAGVVDVEDPTPFEDERLTAEIDRWERIWLAKLRQVREFVEDTVAEFVDADTRRERRAEGSDEA